MTANEDADLNLEVRIHDAYQRLLLLYAGCRFAKDSVMEEDELLEALSEMANEARLLLEPLRHVPNEIARWTPKGGDQ